MFVIAILISVASKNNILNSKFFNSICVALLLLYILRGIVAYPKFSSHKQKKITNTQSILADNPNNKATIRWPGLHKKMNRLINQGYMKIEGSTWTEEDSVSLKELSNFEKKELEVVYKKVNQDIVFISYLLALENPALPHNIYLISNGSDQIIKIEPDNFYLNKKYKRLIQRRNKDRAIFVYKIALPLQHNNSLLGEYQVYCTKQTGEQIKKLKIGNIHIK